MTTVLKLGGSVITEKSSERTLDQERLDAIVGALGDGDLSEYILVLGGGSFGHPAADRHGVTIEQATADPQAIAEIHDAMLELTSLVVDRLIWAGIPAIAMHPMSMARRNEGSLSFSLDPVESAVTSGLVPVLHGDGVLTSDSGVTILSGDEIAVEVARSFGADRVGMCTGVPGVLDGDGSVIDRIERFDDVAEAVGGSDTTDVTGGMAGKVRTLLELGIPASIFDVDALDSFVRGERPGTLISAADG